MGGNSIRKCATGDCGGRNDNKYMRKNKPKQGRTIETAIVHDIQPSRRESMSSYNNPKDESRDDTMLSHEASFGDPKSAEN